MLLLTSVVIQLRHAQLIARPGCNLCFITSRSAMHRRHIAMNGFAKPPSSNSSRENSNGHWERGSGYSQWLQHDNIQLFRGAICKVLDIFGDVVTMQEHSGAIDIFNNLTKLRAEEWRDLQSALDEVDPESSSGRMLSNRESQIVISVLQSLVSSLDSFILAMHSKIDGYINDVEFSTRRERIRLEEELDKVRRDFIDLRWSNNENKKHLRQAQHQVLTLKSSLSEKSSRIKQLEKDANVKLWEEEKKKMLLRSQSKIEEQQLVIEKLKDDVETTKSLLRVASAPQLPGRSPKRSENAEVDGSRLQKQIHYMEKDLTLYSTEMDRLQSNMVGLIRGFKHDLETFTDGLVEKSPFMDSSDESRLQTVEEKLRRIEKFVTKTPLGRLDSFPNHYQQTQGRQPIHLELLSAKFARGELNSLISPRPSLVEDDHRGRNSLAIPYVGFSHESDTSSIGGVETIDASQTSGRQEKGVANPDLMTDDASKINFDAVMRHFPGMSLETVEEQWEQFCKFDKNKNFTLDLMEMMSAMSATVGRNFTAREIKEVMLEADLDGSNTIDFYEYLNVANMLMKKSDKAPDFESRLLRRQRKNLSTACIIQ